GDWPSPRLRVARVAGAGGAAEYARPGGAGGAEHRPRARHPAAGAVRDADDDGADYDGDDLAVAAPPRVSCRDRRGSRDLRMTDRLSRRHMLMAALGFAVGRRAR